MVVVWALLVDSTSIIATLVDAICDWDKFPVHEKLPVYEEHWEAVH